MTFLKFSLVRNVQRVVMCYFFHHQADYPYGTE